MAFSFGKMNDSDATLFIQVSEITGSTQRGAIVDLVKDLKSNNLWSKMKAIYPFVGGTAATHKWNLKDPRDVDAAFRLTFSGGWTHSSNGALPNGTNGFSNTYLAPSSVSTLNSNSLGYYTGTNVSEITADPVNMGSYNSESQAYLVRKSNTSYSARMNGTIFSSGSNSMTGFIVASKQSSTVSVIYSNGISLVSGNSGGTLPTANIYIGNLNLSGVGAYPDGWVKNDFRFAFIGDGLTDAEVSSLYTIVQKYQTTLGRQV